jgi:predicted site-specific integrase-resolvase
MVPDFVPPRIAQGRLGVSASTIYRWVKEGRLRGRRLGGRLWVDVAQAQRDLVRDFEPAVEGLHDAK